MASIKITLEVNGRTTVVESAWDEFPTMQVGYVSARDVTTEIRETVQRLLNAATIGDTKPLRVTLTKETE